MKKFYPRSISTIQTIMAVLSFINIVFCGSIVLLTTKYISNHGIAREFLESVSAIPYNPIYVFFVPILLHLILMGIMYYRNNYVQKESDNNVLYSVLEIIICFGIIYLLYMGYNGIILLIVADIISHMKDNKNTMIFLGVLILLMLLSNYDVVSIQLPMVSLQNYISVYEAASRVALSATHNILESLNLVMFILFMIRYIINQTEENETIQKELSMIHQVNEELQSYAAMTEKIGEDKERKRLAREIHDTLGHALTGIAAGIDACIAMIDRSPKETKEQLYVVSKVVRQGIGDVRGSLNKLRPGALKQENFKDAILQMVEEFSKLTDIQVDVEYDLEKIDFDNTKEDVLFRIIQESITNAKRHGDASKVNIKLTKENDDLYLTIKDNGKGCSDIKTGFGLKHMSERVNMMNGIINFNGEDGFFINIIIPLKKGEQYD